MMDGIHKTPPINGPRIMPNVREPNDSLIRHAYLVVVVVVVVAVVDKEGRTEINTKEPLSLSRPPKPSTVLHEDLPSSYYSRGELGTEETPY